MKSIKLLLAIIACIFFSCCNSGSSSVPNDYDSSLFGGRTESEVKDSLRKVIDERQMESYGDTTGLYKSPVKILSYQFVNQEYIKYKNISLKFKNVSNKNISAIRFKWTGVNAFNEPADMGGILKGAGGGFTDTPLKAGKTTTAEWDINSVDGKKIINAMAYEVMFEDGTKWTLN